MSEERLEIARRLFATNRSGGLDAVMELFDEEVLDPDCEFRSRISSIEGSTFRGREGFRRYVEDLTDALQEWHNEVDEVTLVGPDTVLVDSTFSGTAHSGVAVQLRNFTTLVFSYGRVARILAYPTSAEALEAAGLSE